MVVPIEKVSVKVGCISMGVTSLNGVTGLGPATNSFTSAGPRTVVKGFIMPPANKKRSHAPPFCQHFEFLSVRPDVVQSEYPKASIWNKNGQIAHPHTIPCGFCPKSGAALPFHLKACHQLLFHYQGIMDPGHFSPAGIRDAD